MAHGPDTDAMIVKCPCGFWAHGTDDMVVADVYEKHLAGCHLEGVVPEPEVGMMGLKQELQGAAIINPEAALRKLQAEVLALAEHMTNMTTIIGAKSSVNNRAEGWYQLLESSERRLRSMLERSKRCP